MNSFYNNLGILFRQEWKEVIYSRLLWTVSFIYGIFLLIFILVGSRESLILGFTGINRALFSWSHALVFFLPLLALTTTATVIAQYRENGMLEFFLSQPTSRKMFFLSLTGSRFLALILPLVLLLIVGGVVGLLIDSAYQFLYGVKFFLISASLIWCFLSIGLYISEKCRSQVRGIVLMILIWMLVVTLIDILLIGLVLEFNLGSIFLFFLTELNPVQAARLALLIDLDSSLATLGPVGFFVSNRLGEVPVFWIGVLWPFILGSWFWRGAQKNFIVNDLI